MSSPKYIFFFQNGRLGNQLFQYAALKSFTDSKLYLFGFKEFQDIFDGADAKFINSKMKWINFSKWLFRLFNLLASRRLISNIEEVRTENGIDMNIRLGLIQSLYLCRNSFFQSENMFSEGAVSRLKIKPLLVKQTASMLAKFRAKYDVMIFVHIRRGDYIIWPSPEFPAVLPANWYVIAIEYMTQKYSNPFFIFISDDVPYLKDCFGHLENSFISDGDSAFDFALMSQCDAGILSASSFAWWGTYFAKLNSPQGIFVAPLFWAGHAQCRWYPPGVKTSWLDYLPSSQL